MFDNGFKQQVAKLGVVFECLTRLWPQFAVAFLAYYLDYIATIPLKHKVTHWLDKITVQIFTISELTSDLVTQHGLFGEHT